MEIVKVDTINPNPEVINKAVHILKRGGVLMYPTDTCYGLGVDMRNNHAVEKLYHVKGREKNKPVSIIVKDIKMLESIAQVEPWSKEIINKYLPGSVTFILLNIDFSSLKQGSLGIRIPDYKLTSLISEGYNNPYATTSANAAGSAPAYSIEEFLEQTMDSKYKPDLILDGGVLPKNPPSTVVDATHLPMKIIRQGKTKISEIKS